MIAVENEILNHCKTNFEILDFLWRKTCYHSLIAPLLYLLLFYTLIKARNKFIVLRNMSRCALCALVEDISWLFQHIKDSKYLDTYNQDRKCKKLLKCGSCLVWVPIRNKVLKILMGRVECLEVWFSHSVAVWIK